MIHTYHPYIIFPLGDQALTIDFGNEISIDLNRKVLQLFRQLKELNYPFIYDLVPAYSSLSIYYDIWYLHQHYPDKTAFDTMAELVEQLPLKESESADNKEIIRVPVCYAPSFGWDLQELATAKGLSAEEVISIHGSCTYRVFMIGFLPGFAYMGEVDERIAMPRRSAPRKAIQPGAVGIAGRQTGIYPMEAPGGWQIIGLTPLTKNSPVLFAPGDQVQFYPISEHEFAHY